MLARTQKYLVAAIGLICSIHAIANTPTLQSALRAENALNINTGAGSAALLTIHNPSGFTYLTIHFLQTSFYSDSNCTTLLDTASITDNGPGFSFTADQTIRLNGYTAYTLATNRGITTSNINCMQLYINGGNQTAQGVSCQNFPENCSCTPTCQCTSTQTNSGNWATNPTPCFSQYAYITNSFANTVSRCEINATTGVLSNCITSGNDLDSPLGIAINNGYVYIANSNNDTVSKCTIDSTFHLVSSCTSTGNDFHQPAGIAINNGYAYITNENNSSISQCTIDSSTGSLSNCTSTGSGLSTPIGITINNGYAYIVNQGNSSITQCTINPSTGTLSNCGSTGSGFNSIVGITADNGYAYIPNVTGSSSVLKCTIDPSTGTLSSCASTGSGVTFTVPLGIKINHGFAYIQDGSSVFKCSVNSTTGALSSCASTGSGFNHPFSMAIN